MFIKVFLVFISNKFWDSRFSLIAALFVVLLSCNAPASPNKNYDDYPTYDTIKAKDTSKHIYLLVPHIDTLGDPNFKGLFKKGK